MSELRHFIKMLIFEQNFAHTVIHIINLKRDNFRARSSGWMRVDGQHPLKLPGAGSYVCYYYCVLWGHSELRGHVIACKQTRNKTLSNTKEAEKNTRALERQAPKMATNKIMDRKWRRTRENQFRNQRAENINNP